MKLPALTPSLLALQTPAVRAQLAALGKPKRKRKAPAPVTVSLAQSPGRVEIVLAGMVMPSLANLDWVRANRAKQSQSKVLRPLLAVLRRPPFPWTVTITRVAPKALDVGGNAYTSAKRIQDDLARWAGVDDKTDEVVRYVVEQETGPVACRIVVETRSER